MWTTPVLSTAMPSRLKPLSTQATQALFFRSGHRLQPPLMALTGLALTAGVSLALTAVQGGMLELPPLCQQAWGKITFAQSSPPLWYVCQLY